MVNVGPVVGTPTTVTATLPVVAPEGTETTIRVPFGFQDVIVAEIGGWATLSRLFVDEGTQLDDTTAVRLR